MAVAEPTFSISSVYPPDGVISFFTTTPATVYRVRAYVYDADGTGVAAAQLSPLPSGDVLSWTATLGVSTFATSGETYTATLVAESQTDPDSGYCSRTFAVYDRPQVVLSPAASTTITGLPLTVSWAVTDVTGVSKQVLRVYGSSNVVYATDYKPSLALDSSERSRDIGAADQLQPFVDGESYDVRIVVTNGVGLTTTVTHSVSVSWLPPVTPTATVSTDPDTLTASVTVTGDRTYDFTDVESFTAPESGVITSLAVDGKSTQDGTPTPSAPVAIKSVKSKNLLVQPYANSSKTQNGVTFTVNADYSLTIKSETATADTFFNFANHTTNPYEIAAGTYTLGLGVALPTGVSVTTNRRVGSSNLDSFTISAGSSSGTRTFTASGILRCYVTVASGATVDTTIYPMLESGSPAHDYQPYGSITLVAGTTRTDIDLQGNALRSVPDGTHDELTVDSAGVVTLTQKMGETTQAVTDGVTGTVGVDVLSSTGQIADGAQVVYKLATPQTISLGTITSPFVSEGATVAIDAAVTPTFDATMRAAQSAGTPLTDTLMVVRVSPDGTRHVLADDLESGDSVTDPLPPLGVAYTYEVTGIAATGVPSTPATVTNTADSWAWAFNFGAGAAEVVQIDGNPRASWSIDQGGELYHFADGGAGGGLPVWYGTTDRDEGGTVSFATVGPSTTDRLRDLCTAHPMGWIRDPFGRRWYAHMRPKFDYQGGNLWNVTISWDAARFVEV